MPIPISRSSFEGLPRKGRSPLAIQLRWIFPKRCPLAMLGAALVAGSVATIGGQALMEGVMMRSPNHYAMAVRRTTDGRIVTERRAYTSLTRRSRFWALPILRGMAVLYESLKLGTEALFFSSKVLMEEDPASSKKPKTPSSLQTFLSGLFLTLTFMVSVGIALFLFKFAPLWVAEQVTHVSSVVEEKYWLFNAIDGSMKIAIFISYLLLISLLPDIRRVFAYHGAEHQAIWAYEKGKSLTIAHAQEEHPEHPRCGTSFLILVLLLSIVVYTVLPQAASFWGKLLERIAALPLIAGLSYEVLKCSAKYETHWWMRWVTLPGLWLQKITTKKPTDDMEEVAIAALKEVLKAEKRV